MRISGAGFGADEPDVTLEGLPMVVVSHDPTEIVIDMPPGLAPATYLLTVAQVDGDRRLRAEFEVTVGAEGPQGPQGIPGAQGRKGRSGRRALRERRGRRAPPGHRRTRPARASIGPPGTGAQGTGRARRALQGAAGAGRVRREQPARPARQGATGATGLLVLRASQGIQGPPGSPGASGDPAGRDVPGRTGPARDQRQRHASLCATSSAPAPGNDRDARPRRQCRHLRVDHDGRRRPRPHQLLRRDQPGSQGRPLRRRRMHERHDHDPRQRG